MMPMRSRAPAHSPVCKPVPNPGSLGVADNESGSCRWVELSCGGFPAMDDEQRARLVFDVAGALSGIVSDEIRERAFEHWKNIDKQVGERIEEAIKTARNGAS